MLLVCHFLLTPDEVEEFTARAVTALGLLGSQPGCRGVEVGRAVDEEGRWVLTARFDSVNAYRRSLSPFDVREHVAPLLARCLSESPGVVPTTFETLLSCDGGTVRSHPTLLA
ncbi:MAG: antibiotic biosynthesis monooxygenase family protein [Mycobacteriaceae bacterium]